MALRIVFAVAACWLALTSVRYAFDQFHHLRDLDRYYRAQGFEPFTGEGFDGVSQYLRQHRPRAHCSCPTPSIVPAVLESGWPLALTLFSLGVLVLDLRDPRRWVYLGLIQSLVYWDYVQVLWRSTSLRVGRGFFQPVDIREWDDWMRVPALAQHTFLNWSWPWLLILFLIPAAAPKRTLWLVCLPLAGFAAVRSVLAVAWSESYRPFVGLYRAIADHPTEWFAAALLVVPFAFRGRARWLAMAFAGVTLAILLGTPDPPALAGLVVGVLKPVFAVPWQWREPVALLPVALCGFWIAAWLAGWRKRELLAAIPLLILAAAASVDWLAAQWSASAVHPWPVFESLRLMGLPFGMLATLAVFGSVPLQEANGSH